MGQKAERAETAAAVASVGDPYLAGLQALVAEQGLRALSIVSHEVRDPLTALGASTELLCEDLDVLDKAQIRSLLTGIRGRVQYLRGLVENLISTTALREGRLRVDARPMQLTQTLLEVRMVLEPLLEPRFQCLRLPTRELESLPALMADRRLISQVLMNLTMNASKYAPRGTVIDVFVRRRRVKYRDVVRVTVADQGPGLPPGNIARLFQPFYRAPAGETQPGLGLGLSIVKSIVDEHGGRIGAHNRRGGGACFWFELPVVVDRSGDVVAA